MQRVHIRDVTNWLKIYSNTLNLSTDSVCAECFIFCAPRSKMFWRKKHPGLIFSKLAFSCRTLDLFLLNCVQDYSFRLIVSLRELNKVFKRLFCKLFKILVSRSNEKHWPLLFGSISLAVMLFKRFFHHQVKCKVHKGGYFEPFGYFEHISLTRARF